MLFVFSIYHALCTNCTQYLYSIAFSIYIICTQLQVRDVVGMIICVLCANLEDYKASITSTSGKEGLENTVNWIINEAISASIKCQKEIVSRNESVVAENSIVTTTSISNGETEDVQEAVQMTETVEPWISPSELFSLCSSSWMVSLSKCHYILQVLYLTIAAMKSGRSRSLMHIIVELLQPILSLQVKN